MYVVRTMAVCLVSLARTLVFALLLSNTWPLVASEKPPAPSQLTARVLAPDSVALLQGRESVRVSWQANLAGCAEPRFQVELFAGADGSRVARRHWKVPPLEAASWQSFTLDLLNFQLAVSRLQATVAVCCGFNTCSDLSTIFVQQFHDDMAWLAPPPDDTPPREARLLPSRLVGSDGRGTVWLQREERSALRVLPWLGQEIERPEPPLSEPEDLRVVLVVPDGWWAVARTGLFRWAQEGPWEQVWDSGGEGVVAGAAAAGGVGPCLGGEAGTIWCRDPVVRDVTEAARLEGAPPVSMSIVEGVVWILGADNKLSHLRPAINDVAAPAAVLQTVNDEFGVESDLVSLNTLAPSSDGRALWVAGGDRRGALLYRVSLGGPAPSGVVVAREDVSALPGDILELVEDGAGGLIVRVPGHLCVVKADSVGCLNAAHGYGPELSGMAMGFPGVVWVGDRFLLSAPRFMPSSRPWLLLLGLSGILLTGVLALLCYRQCRAAGFVPSDKLAHTLVALGNLTADHLGWGMVLVALFLPQGLVLAIDRLLLDNDGNNSNFIRLLPACLFNLAFFATLHRRRLRGLPADWVQRRRLSFCLLVVLWAIYLLLWVWPPSPRPPEFDGWFSALHFGLALATGAGTLSHLLLVLARLPLGQSAGRGGTNLR